MATPALETSSISSSSAVVSLRAEIEIDAPASLVFQILADTATWEKWNVLNPGANIVTHNLNNGPIMNIHGAQLMTAPDGTKQFQTLATTFQKGTLFMLVSPIQTGMITSSTMFICHDMDAETRTLGWSYSDKNPFPTAVMNTERAMRVVDLGNGRCKFETLERQSGVKAAYVKLRYGKALQKAFNLQAQELRVYAEAKHKEDQQ